MLERFSAQRGSFLPGYWQSFWGSGRRATGPPTTWAAPDKLDDRACIQGWALAQQASSFAKLQQAEQRGALASQAEGSMEETALHQAAGVFPHLCSPNNFAGRHMPSFIDGDSMPRSSSQSWHLSALRGPAPDPLRGSESGRQEALPQSQKVQSRLAHLKCWLTQAVLTGLEVYISLLVLFQMNLRLLSQTQASLLHIAPIPARSKKKHFLPQRPAARKGSGRWRADKKQP